MIVVHAHLTESLVNVTREQSGPLQICVVSSLSESMRVNGAIREPIHAAQQRRLGVNVVTPLRSVALGFTSQHSRQVLTLHCTLQANKQLILPQSCCKKQHLYRCLATLAGQNQRDCTHRHGCCWLAREASYVSHTHDRGPYKQQHCLRGIAFFSCIIAVLQVSAHVLDVACSRAADKGHDTLHRGFSDGLQASADTQVASQSVSVALWLTGKSMRLQLVYVTFCWSVDHMPLLVTAIARARTQQALAVNARCSPSSSPLRTTLA
eukprot:12880-Heterococcus_DN1.PRE.5